MVQIGDTERHNSKIKGGHWMCESQSFVAVFEKVF